MSNSIPLLQHMNASNLNILSNYYSLQYITVIIILSYKRLFQCVWPVHPMGMVSLSVLTINIFAMHCLNQLNQDSYPTSNLLFNWYIMIVPLINVTVITTHVNTFNLITHSRCMIICTVNCYYKCMNMIGVNVSNLLGQLTQCDCLSYQHSLQHICTSLRQQVGFQLQHGPSEQ